MYVCMYVCFRLAKLYSLVQTFSTWDVLQFRVYRVYIMTCQSNMSADVMYRDRCPLGGLLNRPAADENKGQGGNFSLGVAGLEFQVPKRQRCGRAVSSVQTHL